MLDELIKDPRSLGVAGLLLIAVAALWRGWVIPVVTHNQIVTALNQRIADLNEQKIEARKAAKEAQEELVNLLKRQVEVTDASLRVAEQVRREAANIKNRRTEDKS